MFSMGEGVCRGGGGCGRGVHRLVGRRRVPSPARSPGLHQPERLLQRFGRIERERRAELPSALADGVWHPVQSLASTRAACGWWQVSQRWATFRCAAPAWKATPPPVRVTLGVGAGLHGVGRLDVGVGIVAHPAAPAVGILGGIELRQERAHLVAAEALPLARPQRVAGGVEGHELRLRGELVAGVAVELLLVGVAGSPASNRTAMRPRRIFTSSVRWQPCWAQVVSAGWNRWAERA